MGTAETKSLDPRELPELVDPHATAVRVAAAQARARLVVWCAAWRESCGVGPGMPGKEGK